jgi:TolB-like protein/DNA-binding SARP family transcriptional activator
MADQGQAADMLWTSDATLELLGPVRLTNSAGDELTPKTRKTRALLALVALSKAPLSRGRLSDLLWGDRGEDQAKASLRQALYELRGLTGTGYLTADRHSVGLGPKRLSTDLTAIHRLIDSKDADGLADALEATDWPLLADLDDVTPELDDWLRDERSRLNGSLVKSALCVGHHALAEGEIEAACRIADQLERIDPLDEQVTQLGFRADLAVGDRAGASRRHARFAARLKGELGLQPSEATVALLNGNEIKQPEPTAKSTAPVSSPIAANRRRWLWPAVVGVAIAVAALFIVVLRPWAAEAAPTIAVLPFDDLGQRNQDYFASGVSDEILNLLARQKQFKVLGGVSAAQLANRQNSLDAARRLNVTYLLDGSVRTAGDRVLVIARLMRVADGSQVWSERYERRAGDIFAVQSEIAGAVASRLAQSIAGIRPQETSPAVYDRYLAARQLTRERRDATLAESERLLREAINLDPRYAPAYAELAQVIMLRTDHPTAYGAIPFAQGRAEAEPFARKAVELDPALGDGYAAVGFLSLSLDGSAEPYLRKAVELSPQRADFHRWHAQTLMALNRYDDAIAEYKRAVEIDPLWELSYDHLIGALFLVGREAEGLQYARRFFSLTTDQRGKLMLLKALHDFQTQDAAELQVSRTLYQAYPNERTTRLNYATALALLGERREAAKLVQYDPVATAALRGDWTALARSAEALGPQFWDQAGMWNASELLVASGHGDSIVRLYDQVRGQVDRGQIDAKKIAVPEVIIALRHAGRRADADKLFGLYRQHNAQLPNRGLLGDEKSVNVAVIALLNGDRATAIKILDSWSRRNPFRLFHLPPMALRYDPCFAAAAGDPRFAAIEERVRVAVNAERAKAGLPPISGDSWISDPKTLLTKI